MIVNDCVGNKLLNYSYSHGQSRLDIVIYYRCSDWSIDHNLKY